MRPTWRSVELYRLLQVTLPGAPHVYYGDEAGMWGADDPDDRKPMVWSDLDYAPEAAGPEAPLATPHAVRVDQDLLAFTRRALALRTHHADLFVLGSLAWAPDDARQILAFTRSHGGQTATTVLNLSDRPTGGFPPTRCPPRPLGRAAARRQRRPGPARAPQWRGLPHRLSLWRVFWTSRFGSRPGRPLAPS